MFECQRISIPYYMYRSEQDQKQEPQFLCIVECCKILWYSYLMVNICIRLMCIGFMDIQYMLENSAQLRMHYIIMVPLFCLTMIALCQVHTLRNKEFS